MMPSSPPTSAGKAHTLRELSRSLSHSPRDIPSPSPPPSDSNPTKHSGFGTETSDFFNNPDILMSTQHRIEDETDALPQYPRIRSTAKKVNAWHMLRSEQPNPDTSMVNKEFGDFDQSISDEDDPSVEQGRGLSHSARGTPHKMSSHFDSLYDVTPPTNRSRKLYTAETGSLRRDAQIRRASRGDLDSASPRPSTRISPAIVPPQDRRRASLAQVHAKVAEDESSFLNERPATVTIDSTKNSRWAPRSRQTSLRLGSQFERTSATPNSRPATAQNPTAQSFILPDLPNLTELVSGVFEDGTPVFSKATLSRSRFSVPLDGSRKPSYAKIESVPIPDEEKAIFVGLQLLQDKVSQLERERAECEHKLEDQEAELIALRATMKAQEKSGLSVRPMSSNLDSAKNTWKVERTRLEATVQTLRTKLDRTERKNTVLDLEKKRINSERDNMASQLAVAFQTCEELKDEKTALTNENDTLRQEVDALRAENEDLRDQLKQEHSQRREETIQLRKQFDQAANATEKENVTLHQRLARAQAQNDNHTQQLLEKDIELRKARQEQAELNQLKAERETLKAQLANLQTKREEDVKKWRRDEAALRAQVERKDETIRLFEDQVNDPSSDAIRTENENLRRELAEQSVDHHEEAKYWAQREVDLMRKIKQRESSRKTLEFGCDSLDSRVASGRYFDKPIPVVKGKEKAAEPTSHQGSSCRRDDTCTLARHRVQQEVHHSKAFSASHITQLEESPRKPYPSIVRFTSRTARPEESKRSFSAPISIDKNPYVQSEVESTTDLSLAPRALPTLRGTPHVSRNASMSRPTAAIQPPPALDLTELSFIPTSEIAQLRRNLESELAARRRGLSAPTEEQCCDDTVHSRRQTQVDTLQSIVSTKNERPPSIPRKSSLKDVTQRTTATQFEEGHSDSVSNRNADIDHTATKEAVTDTSMLSNTSRRRRRSNPNEMTSAFIVPDIKLETSKTNLIDTSATQRLSKDHDNANCMVCRREGYTTAATSLTVPKLIPISSRTVEESDATIRPARSPKEALALVVKELQDERAHLHMELAVQRALLESYDPSQGARRRRSLNAAIQDCLRKIEIKDRQIYHLFDVLEGQQSDELTELDVEDITREIRGDDTGVSIDGDADKKGKKVTIRSFVSVDEASDDDDENADVVPRRAADPVEDGETHELPWEGFGDTSQSLKIMGV